MRMSVVYSDATLIEIRDLLPWEVKTMAFVWCFSPQGKRGAVELAEPGLVGAWKRDVSTALEKKNS